MEFKSLDDVTLHAGSLLVRETSVVAGIGWGVVAKCYSSRYDDTVYFDPGTTVLWATGSTRGHIRVGGEMYALIHDGVLLSSRKQPAGA